MFNKRTAIIAALIIAASIGLSSCAMFDTEESKVKKAYYGFTESIEKKNYDQIWNMTSYDTQKQFEDFIYKPFIDRVRMVPPKSKNEKIPGTGVTPAELEKMTAKDFFIFQLQKTKLMDDIAYSFPSGRTVEKAEINGTNAVLHMSKSAPDRKISDTVPMKLEDGSWRIVLLPPGEVKR